MRVSVSEKNCWTVKLSNSTTLQHQHPAIFHITVVKRKYCTKYCKKKEDRSSKHSNIITSMGRPTSLHRNLQSRR